MASCDSQIGNANRLDALDYSVVAGYFALVLVTGLYAMHVAKRSTISGYFLANKSMTWFTVGASLFASNVGSGHFVGLAGGGAKDGLAVASYELNGMGVVLMLGYLFVPIYLSSGCATMPEYLKIRFGGNRINSMIAIFSLLVYIFTKISVDLYAGAIFIQQAMGFKSLWLPIGILLVVTAFFTVGGGLTAVVYTDTLQTVIMLVGGVYVAGVAFHSIGGIGNLEALFAASRVTCGDKALVEVCGQVNNATFMHVSRDLGDEDFPWLGLITGMTINSIWYWCSDQVIVQRCLSAKNYLHAKGATIFAAYIKISTIFVMVMPGMISRIKFPDKVGCADPIVCKKFCASSSCSDVAYPYLVTQMLPHGMIGLMMAVMLSALLSSLTSVFNSASSIFTIDIWPQVQRLRGRPQCTERELMIVGRVFVVVLIATSVAWIPIVQSNQTGTLFVYIQMVSSYLQPPIAAIYLLGIFVPSTNEQGVFWALISGLLLGCTRMFIDMIYQRPNCEQKVLNVPDPRPFLTRNFPYLYFSLFLFVVTICVCVVVSKLTKASNKHAAPSGSTWQTRHENRTSDDSELDMVKSDDMGLSGSIKPARVVSQKGCFSRAINFICGMDVAEDANSDRSTVAIYTAGEPQKSTKVDVLYQDPKWQRFVDVNGALAALACAVLWYLYK